MGEDRIMSDVSNDLAAKRIGAWWWPAIFLSLAAVAFCIRAIVPSPYTKTRSPDYWNYYKPVAENILAGRGLVTPNGAFAVRYPVGHPTFLATIWFVADRVNVSRDSLTDFVFTLMHVATAVLLAWAASHFWNMKWSILLGISWTAFPLAILCIPTFGTDGPYTTVLIGAATCFWVCSCGPTIRYRGLALAGALMGLAMLSRPAALLMPFALAAFLFFCVSKPWRQRLAGNCVFLAVMFVVIMPWEIAIYQNTSEILPLSSGGPVTIVEGFIRPKSSDDNKISPPLPADVEAFVADLKQERHAGKVGSIQQVVVWLANQTVNHPVTVLKVFGYKLIRCWYGTDSRRNETLVLLINIPLLTLVFVGGVRAWRRGGSYRELVLFVLAPVLTSWFTTFTVVALVHYMVPVMGLLFLLIPAAFGCDNTIDSATNDASDKSTVLV